MRKSGVILLAWWLYVGPLFITAPAPYPLPAPNPHPLVAAHPHGVVTWFPRQRFLHREFCELNARQLRREGLEAFCRYVDD
jgi:hypothetical protein